MLRHQDFKILRQKTRQPRQTERQGKKDKGQKTKDKGQKTKDKGLAHTSLAALRRISVVSKKVSKSPFWTKDLATEVDNSQMKKSLVIISGLMRKMQ
jgi:hypothetical protein